MQQKRKTAKKAKEIWIELEAALSQTQEILDEVKIAKEEMEEYKEKLLEGTESEKSIKDKIEELTNELNDKVAKATELYNKILSFYQELFDDSEEEGPIKDQILSSAKDIQDLLSEAQNQKQELDEFYDSVFGKSDSETGERIGGIKLKLEQIQKEIEARKHDIDALLEKATGRSLVSGFLESKREYKREPKYEECEHLWSQCSIRNFIKWLTVAPGIIFEYALFILPLLISVIIFTQPEIIDELLFKNSNEIKEYFKNLDFLSRFIISLPLWWISWFGQRSISQRRRLAEEYNHKAQVAKMYLMFMSAETSTTYPMNDEHKKRLSEVLIDVIERNPAKVYGKDETIIDKIAKLWIRRDNKHSE